MLPRDDNIKVKRRMIYNEVGVSQLGRVLINRSSRSFDRNGVRFNLWPDSISFLPTSDVRR